MSCDFPAGAYGHWNPYMSGNTYVLGVSYDILIDQTGNGRHAVPALTAPSTTADVYPSASEGTVPLPLNSTRFLRFNPGSDESLVNMTSVTWMPMVSVQNNSRFWQLRTSTRQISLQFQRSAPGGRTFYLQMGTLTIWDDISASIGEPPDITGHSTDSYIITAVRVRTPNGTAEFATIAWDVLIIADFDDGNGPVILANDTIEESDTMTGAYYTARDAWRGVEASNMTQPGGHILYRSSLPDEDMYAAIVAGACTMSSAAATAVAAALPPLGGQWAPPTTYTAWLLDVTMGGKTYRYADQPAIMLDSDGTELVYEDGLSELQLEHSADFAAVQITTDLDWETLWSGGQELEGQPAILRRITDGSYLETARTYVRGLTTDAAFGFPGAPGVLTLTVQARDVEGSDLLPAAHQVVSSSTFSGVTLDDQTLGSAFPIVFGFPGEGLYPAWPVYYFEDSAAPYCLMSTRDAPASASTVFVFDVDSNGTRQGREFDLDTTYTDASGAPLLVADLSSPTGSSFTTTPTFGRKYYGSCSRANDNVVSQLNPDGTVCRGAGDVILYVLERYGGDADVDIGRLRESRDALNAYKLDCVINSPIRAWEWIRQAVLPLLPVDERQGPDGRYLRPRTIRVSARDSIATLVGGRDLERAGAPRHRSAPVNDFSIRYAPTLGTMLRTRRLCGDVLLDGLENTEVSKLCRDSHQRYGSRTARPMTTMLVWDEATALRYLVDQALQYAIPWMDTDYITRPGQSWLEEGAVVTLTDGAFSGRLAVVGRPVEGGAMVSVPLSVPPAALVTP